MRGQDFDAKKTAAVKSVAAAYPKEAMPVLGRSLLSDSVSLGVRLQSVAYMRITAEALSSDFAAMPPELASSASPLALSDGKTTIKRPQMLKLVKQREAHEEIPRKKSFRNRFITVADLFFNPVFQCLVSLLRPEAAQMQAWRKGEGTDALRRRRLQDGAEEFNLISELFEREEVGSFHGKESSRVVAVDELKRLKRHEQCKGSHHAPGSGSDVLRSTDGVDSLLPAQCLLALAAFCRLCRGASSTRFFY